MFSNYSQSCSIFCRRKRHSFLTDINCGWQSKCIYEEIVTHTSFKKWRELHRSLTSWEAKCISINRKSCFHWCLWVSNLKNAKYFQKFKSSLYTWFIIYLFFLCWCCRWCFRLCLFLSFSCLECAFKDGFKCFSALLELRPVERKKKRKKDTRINFSPIFT